MSFYDLSPNKRIKLVGQIETDIYQDLTDQSSKNIRRYFSDDDTYIRKSAYLSVGRIYFRYSQIQKIGLGGV
jgi:hypothetical protein